MDLAGCLSATIMFFIGLVLINYSPALGILFFFILFGAPILWGFFQHYKKKSGFHKKLSGWGESGNRKNKLDQMNGYEFEEFVAELFAQMEYRTRVTKKSGDQGVDIIVKDSNSTLAVQTKCYNNKKVSNSAVQEVVAGKATCEADKAIVVTTSDFTNSAKNLAEANKVKLVNKRELLDMVDEYM